MNIVDVPSPIDLRLMSDALEWEKNAMNRPFREDFFAAISEQLQLLGKADLRILELGSGPGFLAYFILSKLPDAQMVLLDFSPAMHELARKRLAPFSERSTFVEKSFKEENWTDQLGTYDAVVTLQAVHELRHKHYATALHQQVKKVLKNQGVYLFCDHYCGDGGMQNDQLFMNLKEQKESLESAGFAVEEVLIKGGRALYRAC
jgi:cyclopropane fatty-acyl-phospholipid synthase-like methyltransferase